MKIYVCIKLVSHYMFHLSQPDSQNVKKLSSLIGKLENLMPMLVSK